MKTIKTIFKIIIIIILLPSIITFLLSNVYVALVIGLIILAICFNKRKNIKQRVIEYRGKHQTKIPIYSGSQSGQPATNNTKFEKDPNAFNRLVGMDKPQREVQDFFDIIMANIHDPNLARKYEIKPPKGLLLYGPPGNGKTAFARACSRYYGFEFIPIKGSELIAGCGLVGLAESNLKELFQNAREKAPSIIFFDEIDAIAQQRSGRSINSASDLLLNNLLTELDGFDPMQKVFIIAATNRKDILDPALVRPGRLEKHILIDNPDRNARAGIFKVHLGRKPASIDINIPRLADMTEGKSGAFIEAAVNRANTEAFRSRRRITQQDLENAISAL